jgi:endonuclease G, mitochondrial
MKRSGILIAVSLLVPFLAQAYQPNSNEHVRFGFPSKSGVILYKKGFVALYDVEKKQPLWVSYHLTGKYLEKTLDPVFSFKPDPALKDNQRAALSDYEKSAYARCRMAPLKDMSRSKDVMKECFLLSNVCPMDQQMYNGFWKQLEEAARQFVLRGNDAWVITGPVFNPGQGKKVGIKKLGWNKIWVPTHFFKVIFYQGKDGSFNAAAFLFENKKQPGGIRDYAMPVEELEKLTGFTFLGKLPDEVGKLVKGAKPSEEKLTALLEK